jgi:hypothetical protein
LIIMATYLVVLIAYNVTAAAAGGWADDVARVVFGVAMFLIWRLVLPRVRRAR